MKKVKIMLMSVAILAVVGGALAFKAKRVFVILNLIQDLSPVILNERHVILNSIESSIPRVVNPQQLVILNLIQDLSPVILNERHVILNSIESSIPRVVNPQQLVILDWIEDLSPDVILNLIQDLARKQKSLR
jgi:hypothetical protein